MSLSGFRKEMRMFTRSPLARAIVFTIIKEADREGKSDEEIGNSDFFSYAKGMHSGGITINVSQGGLCMVTEQELAEHEIIRIDMPLTETFLSAPTLAQVKWVHNLGNNFQIGLAYLF